MTHSDTSATASDLPQSDIKTGIRVKDLDNVDINIFFNSGRLNNPLVSVLNGTSDDTKSYILFFSYFYALDLCSSKHLYDFTAINIPTRCQISNPTKH